MARSAEQQDGAVPLLLNLNWAACPLSEAADHIFVTHDQIAYRYYLP